MRRRGIPRWLAIIGWSAQLVLAYVGAPAGLADLGSCSGLARFVIFLGASQLDVKAIREPLLRRRAGA